MMYYLTMIPRIDGITIKKLKAPLKESWIFIHKISHSQRKPLPGLLDQFGESVQIALNHLREMIYICNKSKSNKTWHAITLVKPGVALELEDCRAKGLNIIEFFLSWEVETTSESFKPFNICSNDPQFK